MPKLLAVELTALLLVAAWAIVFHARLPGRLPEEANFVAVAAQVQDRAQPGDVVLLQPWWTEHARLYLPERVPVVGYLGSDDEPLEDHPRIWLLAQPNLPKAGTADFLERFSVDRTREGEEQRFGNLSLSLWKNGRYRPALFKATEQLPAARVYLEDPRGNRAECPWNGRQHQCPQAAHLRVATEWHEVNQIPRRCLYMHAPGGDARLVAEFQNVPAGERLQLEGGIIWEQAPKGHPFSDIAVNAEVNGVPALSINAKAGVETFYRQQAPSPTAPFTLRLMVSAEKPANREVCISFSSRGAKQP